MNAAMSSGLQCSSYMRRAYCLLPILMLVTWQSERPGSRADRTDGAEKGQNSSERDRKTSDRPALKSIELADTYKIQVPASLEVGRSFAFSVPAYNFREYNPRGDIVFDVLVLPYSPTVAAYRLVPIDEATGLFELPFTVGGSKLTTYFKMPDGNYVYYDWNTTDSAYMCTMNSSCPVRTSPNSRYYTVYEFVVFDKRRDSIIDFFGYSFGPSKHVKRFTGVGKLLREVIVPSLQPIQ